jgi:two-component system LytT family response regulator
MIKAVIVDDELHCIDRLKNLLTGYFEGEILVISTYTSIEEAYVGLQAIQPDLVFLDIQIHDQTGFDLLGKLQEIKFDVVFTTAYEQYAIKAFKFSASDYLLKPIDVDDLKETIKRINKRRHQGSIDHNLDLLIENVKNLKNQNRKIAVPTINGLVFLNIQDILHCKSDVNYTTIFMKDSTSLMVAKTLKEFEGLLSNHDFFRVHNSHLINLNYIKSYNKGKGGFLTLEDNSEIEVSSRRKEGFLQRLAEF